MWKLKIDEAGKPVMNGNQYIWIAPDGKEVQFDMEGTQATLVALRGEAKGHREGKEKAELELKKFEGIDPVKAKAALEITANMDAKKLVDAGQVETVRQEAINATEAKYQPIVAERDNLQKLLVEEKIGGAFARSPLIVGDKAKLAIPADLVQARFGAHFSLGADGKVTAKDANGNPIYSKANGGLLATFDEALEIIVDQYPQKDSILKGSGGSGSGTPPSNGQPGGGKTMTRAQFDAADQATRMSFSKGGGKVVEA